MDALRGAIMMLMAIDHIRDYVARSAMHFSPTDLSQTTAAIFLTRWITHFCAPVFLLTAGMGAFLWRMRGNHSKRELSWFLVTRGLWLIVIEATVLRVITFSEIAYRGQLVILVILWAIGLSMIALSVLAYLPVRWLAIVSASLIFLHNLLDGIPSSRFGHAAPLWDILHTQGIFTISGIRFLTAYPVLPWIGVICAGYCLGGAFIWDPVRRRNLLMMLGLSLTALFLIIRSINRYGDPAPWVHEPSALFTILSFLNCTKYPPSLDFLLMTLGPAIFALALLGQVSLRSANPLLVFGRVPFFFYAAHLFLAHLLTVLMNLFRYGWKPILLMAPPSMGGAERSFPADYGFPLWVVFAVWVVVLALLYPVCLWFARVKQRRKDWWLSYL